MRICIALLLGASLGVLGAVTDALGSGYPPSDTWRAASVVANFALVWAGSAVLAGWIARHSGLAAITGLATLVTAVVTYYAYGLLVGNHAEAGVSAIGHAARFWLVVAVIGGPVLGVIGAMCRLGGPLGLAARLVVPLGLLAEIAWRLRWGLPTHDPGNAVGLSVLLLGALVLTALAVRASSVGLGLRDRPAGH